MPFLDAIPLFGPWRIKRDTKKYQQWLDFLQTKGFKGEVFQIIRIRKSYRKKGTKAYGRWLDGSECAVWIPKVSPSVGMFISAEGGNDHGKHHNEEVFYVNKLLGIIDGKYFAAMRRHIARASNTV